MSFQKDIFISYGRRDSKQFARHLYKCLKKRGYSVWFDFEDIPAAADFQKQIDEAIPKADYFLFIISPHSSKSPYCRKEIERAVALNKRIVPIMHVDQITRQVWQSRNPNGTDDEWATYQAIGEDSCFTYMHPEIRKLNWNQLNFKDLKHFEQPFQTLIDLLAQERPYAHQHTDLLLKALDWERNQKRTQYLLIGEDRQKAEVWIKKSFKDPSYPCIPTNLHCEFITESIKNANNLMTQVFLCHSRQDQGIAKQIQLMFMRSGITTWTHYNDIQFGTDFEKALLQGIEESDNVVFLMSPHSLQSQYCGQELNYALSLNKRIIPIRVGTINFNQIPSSLTNLQYISLIDTPTEVHYHQIASDLLRILQQDVVYHYKHKVLLTKALKWEGQKRNPCMLLQGYELQNAEAWLKLAKQYPNYGPTPLQEEFIRESTLQPAGASLDVFISYSQADSDFTRKLNESLQRQGKRTWFDQESIAPGVNFQHEIHRGIEASDHFLFILSPSSVTSPYCNEEVNYAVKLNKRIVTVRHRSVKGIDLHPDLATVQWIDFQENDADFTANLQELIRTLDQDPEHLKFHTRLLAQALAWEDRGRRNERLLRGKDLAEAVQWLLMATEKQPSPTELQKEYIAESRKLGTKLLNFEKSYKETTQILKSAVVYHRPKVKQVISASLATSALVIVARFIGLLAPLELVTFSALTQLKPVEEQDKKILVIEVTEADIEAQLEEGDLGGGTLSDTRLNRLLRILEASSPRVIGLDFYRNFEPNLPELSQRMVANERVIAICKLPETKGEGIFSAEGVAPPPKVPLERIGFSDVIPDWDGVIRRQLLLTQVKLENSPCTTESSFSLQLTKYYLALDETLNIDLEDAFFSKGDLFIGKKLVPRLNAYTGPYQYQTHEGYQILMNYRKGSNGDIRESFQRVSLGDVLEGKVADSEIRDKLILIGLVAKSSRIDIFETPHVKELPGVLLQAQMTSQLINYALGERSLIWVWPFLGETLWIWSWALVGGIITRYCRRRLHFGFVIMLAFGGLTLCCCILMVGTTGLVPLVPSTLTLMITGGGLISLAFRPATTDDSDVTKEEFRWS